MKGKFPLIEEKTFLIVEDDNFLRTMLVEDFESSGIKCLAAVGGAQALELIKNEKVDIIISDVRMPTGGGLELYRKIKDANLHEGITFYLVSGCNDIKPSLIEELNIREVFEKPFIISDVLGVIEGHFQK